MNQSIKPLGTFPYPPALFTPVCLLRDNTITSSLRFQGQPNAPGARGTPKAGRLEEVSLAPSQPWESRQLRVLAGSLQWSSLGLWSSPTTCFCRLHGGELKAKRVLGTADVSARLLHSGHVVSLCLSQHGGHLKRPNLLESSSPCGQLGGLPSTASWWLKSCSQRLLGTVGLALLPSTPCPHQDQQPRAQTLVKF